MLNNQFLVNSHGILPIFFGLLNSLAPGRFEWNFRYIIFKLISVTDGWCISCKIALRWMPLDLTNDKPTLVQVMAWCRQATSHYLRQCWPRFMSPYGVTRPQWVNWYRGNRIIAPVPVNQHWRIGIWKITWWRHQMETFSAILDLCAGNSPVTGEFPAHGPVTRSFDVFFDLRLNKRLSKQS